MYSLLDAIFSLFGEKRAGQIIGATVICGVGAWVLTGGSAEGAAAGSLAGFSAGFVLAFPRQFFGTLFCLGGVGLAAMSLGGSGGTAKILGGAALVFIGSALFARGRGAREMKAGEWDGARRLAGSEIWRPGRPARRTAGARIQLNREWRP